MLNENERGKITDKIKEISKNFLGEEISQLELRLYPYIDYCLKNGGYLERAKMSREEIGIIQTREQQGYCKRHYDGSITVTREFYNYMQDVLAEGYVLWKF